MMVFLLMVNCIHQLDWTTGYSEMWSNTTLEVSVRVSVRVLWMRSAAD